MNEHDQQFTVSPGAMLRMARERCGFNQAEVAAKLRLSTKVIQDIEQDNYRHAAAMIYVRGYLRSYARHVGLKDAEVLIAFESLNITDPAEYTSSVSLRQLPFTEMADSKAFPTRWILIGVLLLLIIAATFVWYNQRFAGTEKTAAVSQAPTIATMVKPFDSVQSSATLSTVETPAAATPVASMSETFVKKSHGKAKTNKLKPNYNLVPAEQD